MKVLIIMHSSNIVYGAAKSLQKLIECCDWDIDIVYPKSHFHPVSNKTIIEYSHYKADKVYSLYLPFRKKAVYAEKSNVKKTAWEIAKRIFEFRDRFKLNKIIKEGNYDFIFLNSIVLYPLIAKNSNYIMYVREMIVHNKKIHNLILKKLLLAKRIVFIDKAITVPFKNDYLSYKIINNPFDMRDVRQIDREQARKKYLLDKNQIIISLIGLIAPNKGTEFVISVMNELNRKDITLFIVGTGDSDYVGLCKKISKNENIRFLGEMSSLNEIYSVSDYIIRADQYLATGRTVYEGLYSGCSIILQKEDDDDPYMISDYQMFSERIYFYNVRDESSLLTILDGLRKITKESRYIGTNIEKYKREIDNYISP